MNSTRFRLDDVVIILTSKKQKERLWIVTDAGDSDQDRVFIEAMDNPDASAWWPSKELKLKLQYGFEWD